MNSPTRHVFAHGGLTLASAPARTLAASQPAASGCTANELASSESSAHGLRSRSNTLQYGGLQRDSGVVTVAVDVSRKQRARPLVKVLSTPAGAI